MVATAQVNQGLAGTVQATAAGDAGVISILVAVCSCFACCFSPVTEWYNGLPTKTKIYIDVAVSLLLGSWDIVSDWIVCITWYSTGEVWWATGILASIILGGLPTMVFQFSRPPYWFGFLSVCGLGMYFDAYSALQFQPGIVGENLALLSITRVSETCLESMIAGAIQIYVATRKYIVHENLSTPLEYLSIVASILSIGYGFSAYVCDFIKYRYLGKAIPTDSDISGKHFYMLAILVAMDWVFRVLCLSFFIIAAGDTMKWYVLPITWFIYVLYYTCRFYSFVSHCGEFCVFTGLVVGLASTSLISCVPSFWGQTDKPTYFNAAPEFIVRFIVNCVELIVIFSVQPQIFTWIHYICVVSGSVSVVLFPFVVHDLVQNDFWTPSFNFEI